MDVQSLKRKFSSLESSNLLYIKFDTWFVKFDKGIYPQISIVFWYFSLYIIISYCKDRNIYYLAENALPMWKGCFASKSIVGDRAFNNYDILSRINRILVKYLKHIYECPWHLQWISNYCIFAVSFLQLFFEVFIDPKLTFCCRKSRFSSEG